MIDSAHYRCCKCGHEWEQPPAQVTCPKCSHEYVKWVNYEAWRERNPLEEEVPMVTK